jgi:hypothetical protein
MCSKPDSPEPGRWVTCTPMTKPPTDPEPLDGHRDQDVHKGAMEEGRPGKPQPTPPGLDKNGLPNNATAIAQDREGANEDKTQG